MIAKRPRSRPVAILLTLAAALMLGAGCANDSGGGSTDKEGTGIGNSMNGNNPGMNGDGTDTWDEDSTAACKVYASQLKTLTSADLSKEEFVDVYTVQLLDTWTSADLISFGPILKAVSVEKSITLDMTHAKGITNLPCFENMQDEKRGIFNGCLALTTVLLPDTLETIGDYAFSGCKWLARITIPASLKEVGSCAFLDCASIAEVVHTGNLESWLGIYFYANVSNPCYGSYIGGNYTGAELYINGELVTDIIIPGTVSSIGQDAFCGCSSLKSVKISDGVMSMGFGAFEYCRSLESVTIPGSVSSIDWAIFNNCGALKNVTLSFGLESIGVGMFDECISLETIEIPSTVKSIGDIAFDGCQSLKTITIPDGVESIGEGAFGSCDSLSSINLPASLKSIGARLFAYCSNLQTIDFDGTIAEWNNITKLQGSWSFGTWYTDSYIKQVRCKNGNVTVNAK